MAQTYQLQSFSGPFTAETEKLPALRWLKAYTENICALGFSDPGARWYAPSSVYINCDGKVVRGGDEIWSWVAGEIFGAWDGIDVDHEETRIRIIHRGAPAYYEDEHLKKNAPQDADVVLYEHIIIFSPRNPDLKKGGPIPVRRMMEWIVGRSENDLGYEGLQCWQGKVCWDVSVVKEEMARRMKAAQEEPCSDVITNSDQ